MVGALLSCCYTISRASGERVDWLYRGPMATNKEEYLLGKKIDKAVDPTLIEEEREKEVIRFVGWLVIVCEFRLSPVALELYLLVVK